MSAGARVFSTWPPFPMLYIIKCALLLILCESRFLPALGVCGFQFSEVARVVLQPRAGGGGFSGSSVRAEKRVGVTAARLLPFLARPPCAPAHISALGRRRATDTQNPLLVSSPFAQIQTGQELASVTPWPVTAPMPGPEHTPGSY